jgi:preprotein translocase subunit Sss1
VKYLALALAVAVGLSLLAVVGYAFRTITAWGAG